MSILCVVTSHVLISLIQSGLIANEGVVRLYRDAVHGTIMPAFFFVSGIFIARYATRSWGEFFKDRFQNNIYPYVLWILLYGCIHALVPEHHTVQDSDLSDLWRAVYMPLWHYWFLYALFFSALYYIALRKMGLSAAALLALSALAFALQGQVQLPWAGIYMPQKYLLFLALGAYLGRDGVMARFGRMTSGRLTLLSGIGLALLLTTVALFGREYFMLRPVTTLFGGVAMICASTLLERYNLCRFIQFWGRKSMEIYLAHVIFAAVARIGLLRILHVNDPILLIPICIAAGVYGPIALDYAARRLGLKYLFALKDREAPSTPAVSVGFASLPVGVPAISTSTTGP